MAMIARAREMRKVLTPVRDAVFVREGLLTLRYDNLMVRDDLNAVIDDVRTACLARPTRSPLRSDHPPPQGEGEDRD